MPTYREIEDATGASPTLIKTLAKELDPKCEQRRKEGKRWVVSDQLAALIADKATRRLRKPNRTKDTGAHIDAIQIIEEAHRREIEAIRRGHDAELEAARSVAEGLRESVSERDRTIEGLRAEIAALRAENDEIKDTLANITGARWYTRAFNLRRLLPGATKRN